MAGHFTCFHICVLVYVICVNYWGRYENHAMLYRSVQVLTGWEIRPISTFYFINLCFCVVTLFYFWMGVHNRILFWINLGKYPVAVNIVLFGSKMIWGKKINKQEESRPRRVRQRNIYVCLPSPDRPKFLLATL